MMTDSTLHDSVLLKEAVDSLDVKPSSIIIDGTFGRGGHSRLILEKLDQQGLLIGFDKDPEAIEFANLHWGDDQRFVIEHRSFAEIETVVRERQLQSKVNGVLLDLGVSSPQIDQAERGFSFMKDGPLDMRMDPTQGISAAQWLNKAKEGDIKYILRVYGEEKFAPKIARAIVAKREEETFVTTKQLAKLIADVVPHKDIGKHPATRSFQAIRIYINEELSDLEKGLDSAFKSLAIGGRLVVISFHSLEDRIVKRFFKKLAKSDDFPSDLPVRAEDIKPRLKMIGKALKPERTEIDGNVRSRSAIMRVAEKLCE